MKGWNRARRNGRSSRSSDQRILESILQTHSLLQDQACLAASTYELLYLTEQQALTRQRDPIVCPAPTILVEETRLIAGTLITMCKVIATADESRGRCAVVVVREGWVFVRQAFSGFDVDEAKPAVVVGSIEVNGRLVVRDVEAVDRVALLVWCCVG
jgi:hypothetical protein